jgi:hypothetical protein
LVGIYAWALHGSFPFDSPPKSVSKGARFWGFRCSRVRGVLGGISSIPDDLKSFGGPNLGYGVPMRCSYYPQSLAQIHGAIREIGSWIWGSWPTGVVHPEMPRRDRSDRCSRSVWPVLALCGICLEELLCSCGVVLFFCCLVLGSFGIVLLGFVRGFPSWQVVLWEWFLFQGLEESLRLPGTSLCIYCLPPVGFTGLTGAIGLTGKSHRSDRWDTGNRLLSSPLCVWVV